MKYRPTKKNLAPSLAPCGAFGNAARSSTIHVLIGLPASGKSTWAQEYHSKNPDSIIFSCDEMREKLGLPADANIFGKLYDNMGFAIKHNVTNDLILDAPNLTRKRRMGLSNQFKDCNIVYHLFLTPYEECIRRNEKRDRIVPLDRWISMRNALQVPSQIENMDSIQIHYANTSYHIYDDLMKCRGVSHDNPHHMEDLYTHMMKTANGVLTANPEIYEAALYHDVGKLYTKTFTNMKGESTDIAHFYGHENVSAYLYLLDEKTKEDPLKRLYEADLISWHMAPFTTFLDEKPCKKYKALIRESNPRLWDDILALNIADREAAISKDAIEEELEL